VLDGKCDEESEEQPALGIGIDDETAKGFPIERARTELLVGKHPETDEADQHEEATDQAVQQELDCCIGSAGATEATDDEVHRDEDGFEEDIEEEDVSRSEDADHHCFGEKREDDVLLDGSAMTGRFVPTGNHHDRNEQSCQAR